MKGIAYRIAVVAAVVVFTATSCHHKEKATVAEAVRVKTMAVATTDITTSRQYSGTVEESSSSALSFPVGGTIARMAVGEGDRVVQGQTIATIDAQSLRNSYEIAAAALAQAEDAHRRMKMLHDANSLPDMQWVEVENTLKQAQSAAAIAKKAMNDAVLTAPFSGYIAAKYADAGMTVAPSIPVVKLVVVDPAKVSISIPENEISGMKEGTTARIRVGALGGEEFEGRITEKAVSANALSRSYDVKLTVPNPGGRLLPGMICDLALNRDSAMSAIVLPPSVVLLDSDNSNFVWLDSAGYAVKRVVGTGGMDAQGIIVTSGVMPGDSVIVEGQQKVSRMTPVISINK